MFSSLERSSAGRMHASRVGSRTPRAIAATHGRRNEVILGELTKHRGIAVDAHPREWLIGAPICPALREHSMLHLGVVEAVQPYRFVLEDMRVTEFMACLSGEGRVLIDGEWTPCRAGQAVLLPVSCATAYYAVGVEPWHLVWVCYEVMDIAPLASPVIAAYSPLPLFHAVESLREECQRDNDPSCIRALVAAIHRFVTRFCEAPSQNARLHALWQKVSADLGSDWTLERLSAEMSCCGEQLRRLCQREFGRSPMQNVTYLRLQHAADLLKWADYKVEYIASLVGYHDPFAFSTAFKKWIGCSPTEYRQRRVSTVGGVS